MHSYSNCLLPTATFIHSSRLSIATATPCHRNWNGFNELGFTGYQPCSPVLRIRKLRREWARRLCWYVGRCSRWWMRRKRFNTRHFCWRVSLMAARQAKAEVNKWLSTSFGGCCWCLLLSSQLKRANGINNNSSNNNKSSKNNNNNNANTINMTCRTWRTFAPTLSTLWAPRPTFIVTTTCSALLFIAYTVNRLLRCVWSFGSSLIFRVYCAISTANILTIWGSKQTHIHIQTPLRAPLCALWVLTRPLAYSFNHGTHHTHTHTYA